MRALSILVLVLFSALVGRMIGTLYGGFATITQADRDREYFQSAEYKDRHRLALQKNDFVMSASGASVYRISDLPDSIKAVINTFTRRGVPVTYDPDSEFPLGKGLTWEGIADAKAITGRDR